MTRVLSTDQARQAVTTMQAVINTGLADQIRALTTQGQTLCQPDVWDGMSAARFRSTWPSTEASLRELTVRLEELRTDVQRINEAIMTAGGNA